MDIDAEMARLSREARAKLDAEGGDGESSAPESSATAARDDVSDIDPDTLAAAKRLVERPGPTMSMGGKVVTVLVALVVAWVLWSYVVAPLLVLAILVAIIAAIVWVVIKLMDDGDDDAETKKKSGS